jgi:zinc transport system substrate-binding protein
MRLPSLFFALIIWPSLVLAQVPRVLTDIAPLTSLVAQVMGELGTPQRLITGATDPHSTQLRPSQARALARADVVFWIGPALTPWLDNSLTTLVKQAIIVALPDTPGTVLRTFDNARLDPHAWLDPANAALWLPRIAATLAEADPANAATYNANARAAARTIAALITHSQARLTAANPGNLITSHDAFGYFAARFGLRVAASLAGGDAARPGAARLAQIRAVITSENIACILIEPQENPALARTLAQGSATRIVTFDPLASTLPAGPDLYRALIAKLTDTVAGCTLP